MEEKAKTIPKFIWKNKGSRIATAILNKSSNVGGITTLNFK